MDLISFSYELQMYCKTLGNTMDKVDSQSPAEIVENLGFLETMFKALSG